ncbi:MAG: D-alanyl-D-alanine carboxypeptidase family protein [Vicinamibacterales bacterium]
MAKHGRFPVVTRVLGALVAILTLGVPILPFQAAPEAAAATATAAQKKKSSAAAARARRARAAAAARARALRDAQTPRFRVDETGREVPDVRAAAAIIYNPETNEVVWESNAMDQRSIASITKVMTALVILESGADLSETHTVARSDVSRASTTYLRTGYKVTGEGLLHLMLIGSDNAAARAIARTSPYGAAGFIDRMNAKAAELGLESTHYADPSGLLADNVSSAFDMARLIAYAAADDRIGSIMRTPSESVNVGRRSVTVRSTNQLVRNGDLDVVGGKTGFISRAGYCLATLLRIPETGQKLAVVVLGAQSNVGRFWEVRHLFNWMATRTTAVFAGGADAQHQQQQQQ